MYIPFEEITDEARIWIYQSNRKFSELEEKEIYNSCLEFIENWNAHGTPLKGSFEIKHNRFIIFAVDNEFNSASGCSIDASVHFIQTLESKYQIDLLDKMNVTYRTGEFIAYKSLLDFKKMAKEKAVNGKTIVFNNLINTKGELLDFWELPAEESWHSRFF